MKLYNGHSEYQTITQEAIYKAILGRFRSMAQAWVV